MRSWPASRDFVTGSPRQDTRSKLAALGGLAGFHRYARRPAAGTASLISSGHFPLNPSIPCCTVIPVMFPPGRARLATKPDPTGSPVWDTIGTVVVARWAARVTGFRVLREHPH